MFKVLILACLVALIYDCDSVSESLSAIDPSEVDDVFGSHVRLVKQDWQLCQTCLAKYDHVKRQALGQACIMHGQFFQGFCTVTTLPKCRSACLDQGYPNGRCILTLHCACVGGCMGAGGK